MSEHHCRRVRLMADIVLNDGTVFVRHDQAGVCTADLPDDDVFAVWFDEPVASGVYWVTFSQEHKRLFEAGELDEQFVAAEANARDMLRQRGIWR